MHVRFNDLLPAIAPIDLDLREAIGGDPENSVGKSSYSC